MKYYFITYNGSKFFLQCQELVKTQTTLMSYWCCNKVSHTDCLKQHRLTQVSARLALQAYVPCSKINKCKQILQKSMKLCSFLKTDLYNLSLVIFSFIWTLRWLRQKDYKLKASLTKFTHGQRWGGGGELC